MLLARYGGLGSHRYGAFFTGDANSDWHVLQLQCEFNIRAGGVGNCC
jgi:alpha-glucosidase (family GH31 glycosyl hydrolase)